MCEPELAMLPLGWAGMCGVVLPFGFFAMMGGGAAETKSQQKLSFGWGKLVLWRQREASLSLMRREMRAWRRLGPWKVRDGDKVWCY